MTEKQTRQIPTAYNPADSEDRWYQFWLENGYFKPVIDPDKTPFTIIMPPPNVTGELHVGHALTATLQDIMVRWHRMKGDPTLWLPGVDHAGIATQVMVEKQLAKEGLNRHEIGREEFLKRTWEWVGRFRGAIARQHTRLGVSCDWSREVFTLDPGPCRAVRTTFYNLYNEGLIYRGERITNWCPRCATALSDLEVNHQELAGNLYYIRYPVSGEPGNSLMVATTRPETMLGDSAVAVNPEDERFNQFAGKKLVLPLVGRVIPVVADEAVATGFGTGAVKVTPAHDPVDFEIGQRHNLEIINILNRDATLNEKAGKYAGLDIEKARKQVVADLGEAGLLEKVESYSHSVGHCQRCSSVVEPIVSRQWFVTMEPLARPAIEAVNNGSITIIPERFNKVYLNWMENIRDWCISRQLWWGHRIPVWYCQDCGEVIVSIEDATTCTKCGSSSLKQDEDVLDTWFSSALWPHSTLGWPDDSHDLKYFYPTSVMETAYDILFFWVARMIMMGLKNTGQIPFKLVYLHGLIRDEKGEKMSKTRGNSVDPLKVVEEYGACALRFAVSTGTAPGNDTKLSANKLEAGRNFANKLWNATRFVIRSLDEAKNTASIKSEPMPAEDRWILSRLNRVTGSVNRLMEEYQFGEALREIHDFLWGEYCDWYLEITKIRLKEASSPSPIPVLLQVLETSLRLLHPFMPFITEELWQQLREEVPGLARDYPSIMVSNYPRQDTNAIDEEAENLVGALIETIRLIRNLRSEHNVELSHIVDVKVFGAGRNKSLEAYLPVIRFLARANPVFLEDREANTSPDDIVSVGERADIAIPLKSLVDVEKEKARLSKEIIALEADVERLAARLTDEKFTTRAPAAVVDKERVNLQTRSEKLEKLKAELARL
ncbi:MAG: valine--tRNA ligase [Dehalococcoidales bacterium]|jgi:valyl-tRNA synthetase|nr:valine--tRNA ligase [Dehalococcoidales bacterium]MDX9803378.1 valine--tRNA ligase [Dehalococcoidales bacterium]